MIWFFVQIEQRIQLGQALFVILIKLLFLQKELFLGSAPRLNPHRLETTRKEKKNLFCRIACARLPRWTLWAQSGCGPSTTTATSHGSDIWKGAMVNCLAKRRLDKSRNKIYERSCLCAFHTCFGRIPHDSLSGVKHLVHRMCPGNWPTLKCCTRDTDTAKTSARLCCRREHFWKETTQALWPNVKRKSAHLCHDYQTFLLSFDVVYFRLCSELHKKETHTDPMPSKKNCRSTRLLTCREHWSQCNFRFWTFWCTPLRLFSCIAFPHARCWLSDGRLLLQRMTCSETGKTAEIFPIGSQWAGRLFWRSTPESSRPWSQAFLQSQSWNQAAKVKTSEDMLEVLSVWTSTLQQWMRLFARRPSFPILLSWFWHFHYVSPHEIVHFVHGFFLVRWKKFEPEVWVWAAQFLLWWFCSRF